jgi:hypothetical protein
VISSSSRCASDEIDLAGALLQPRRHLGEQRIAGSVTKRVVDVLEAVEVEAEHRHQVAVALAAGDRAVEMLVELQAVRQAGERVVHGEITNLILGEPALADAPRGDGRGHREAQDNEQACGQRHHRERDIGQGFAVNASLTRQGKANATLRSDTSPKLSAPSATGLPPRRR